VAILGDREKSISRFARIRNATVHTGTQREKMKSNSIKNYPPKLIRNLAEKKYACYLQDKKIDYIYQPKLEHNGIYFYRPDFLRLDNNTYIEVVGTRQAFSINRKRYVRFPKYFPNYKLRIVRPDDSDYIMNIKNRELFKKCNSLKGGLSNMAFQEIVKSVWDRNSISVSRFGIIFTRSFIEDNPGWKDKKLCRIYWDGENRTAGFKFADDRGYAITRAKGTIRITTPTLLKRAISEKNIVSPCFDNPDFDFTVKLY
jgi:hypothetical protein